MNRRVIRATDEGWEGIEAAGYAPEAPGTGVARHTLVGERKSNPSEPGPRMELRYFEVQPGAASRLEKHEHEHYVIVRRGLGYAVIGDTATEIGADDVVYVGTVGTASIRQPRRRAVRLLLFRGYLPRLLASADPEELARLEASPAGAVAKPFAVPPPAKR